MDLRILWGDVHNHNTVGLFHYTKGSLERSIAVAQSHLDFFAFTGHGQWHDMPEMPGDRHLQWQEGFDHHARLWDTTRRLIREANVPERFVAFLGYEWHSAFFGDYCVLYRDDGPLQFANHVRELQEHARRTGALLVPHHIGYQKRFRGANWDYWDESVSPIVEIFSEHGGAERDRGPFAYTRHGLGPRVTENTLQEILARGFHMGVVASSDNHHAHPGAYGEGMVAVLVPEFGREEIWEALRQRRCYAVTGDRIELDVRINGRPMGTRFAAGRPRAITVRVRGWDELAQVALLKNNRVIHRLFPADSLPAGELSWSRRHRCRIEVGWGPWSAFGTPRLAEWEVTASVEGAHIRHAMPCFQAGPFQEERFGRLLEVSGTHCRWQAWTSRSACLNDTPTDAVVLDLEGPPDARLIVEFRRPLEQRVVFTLHELAAGAQTGLTGPFPADSWLIHRLVPDELASATITLVDEEDSGRPEDCYYVRVMQENGQAAWSSPIWVVNEA